MAIGIILDDALTPDVAEPIVAWRVWGVFDDADVPVLLSMNNTVWPNTTYLTAKCVAISGTDPYSDHASPSRECKQGIYGCGIYGYKDIADIFADFDPATFENGLVFGQILLFGNVFEHDKGYRAQHAQIRSLAFFRDRPIKLTRHERLGKTYGVPVQEAPITEREALLQHTRMVRDSYIPLVNLSGDDLSDAIKVVRGDTRLDLMWGILFIGLSWESWSRLSSLLGKADWLPAVWNLVILVLLLVTARMHLLRRKQMLQYLNELEEIDNG